MVFIFFLAFLSVLLPTHLSAALPSCPPPAVFLVSGISLCGNYAKECRYLSGELNEVRCYAGLRTMWGLCEEWTVSWEETEPVRCWPKKKVSTTKNKKQTWNLEWKGWLNGNLVKWTLDSIFQRVIFQIMECAGVCVVGGAQVVYIKWCIVWGTQLVHNPVPKTFLWTT